MRRLGLLLLLLLVPVGALAQPRPGAFTTLTASSTVTLAGPVTITNTTAGALDIGGGINAGTGNVAIVGADGRIPALSSTTVASQTITSNWASSGTWTFIGLPTISAGGTTDNILAFSRAATIRGIIGTAGTGGNIVSGSAQDDLVLRAANTAVRVTTDNGTSSASVWTATTGVLTHSSALVLSGTISPSLGGVNQNDWAPTGAGSSYTWSLASGGGSPSITGIAGGVDGREIALVIVSGASIVIPNESASSTAANRIFTATGATCTLSATTQRQLKIRYVGALSRWVVVGTCS